MRKRFLILSALLAAILFSINVNAGQFTIRLYVAEDAGIDINNDVIGLRYEIEDNPISGTKYSDLYSFSHQEGRWLNLTINADVEKLKFRLWLNETEDLGIYKVITGSTDYELFKYDQYNWEWGYSWRISPIDSDSIRHHNLTATNLQVVTNNDITTFSWDEGTSDSKAKIWYAVVLVKDGVEKKYPIYQGYGEISNPFSVVLNNDTGNELVYDSWYVISEQAIGENDEGMYYAESAIQPSFTVPAKTLYISDLQLEQSGDEINTYILKWKWNGAEPPHHFRVSTYYTDHYNNTSIPFSISLNSTPITCAGEYYQTTLSEFTMDSTYTFVVKAWATQDETRDYTSSDTKWNAILYDAKTVEQKIQLKNLNDVTFSLLIPSDASFDINEDIYIAWRTETQADTLLLTPSEGRWKSANFHVDAIYFDYKISTDKNFYSNTTLNVYHNRVFTPSVCTELLAVSYYRSVIDVECDAPDHDYRATNVQITPNEDGTFLVKWEAKDKAAKYEIALQHDKWYVGIDKIYTESNTNSVLVYNTRTDTLHIKKFYLWAYDEYHTLWCYQEIDIENVEILPSQYIVSNITAETNDNKTFTIRWNKTKADIYSIGVQHKNYGTIGVYEHNITDTSYTVTLDLNGTYDVWVRSYTYNDETKESYFEQSVEHWSYLDGGITVKGGIEYTIADVSVEVDNGVAHITWETNASWTNIYIEDDNYNSYIDYDNQFLQEKSFDFNLPDLEDRHYTVTLTPYMEDEDGYKEKIGESIQVQFTNTGEEMAVDAVYSNPIDQPRKILNNGHVFILRGNKTYTLTGQEVK